VHVGQYNCCSLHAIKQQKSTPCSHAIQLTVFNFAFLQPVIKAEIDRQLTFFSDEACFHLEGYKNTQNELLLEFTDSTYNYEVLLHPVKVAYLMCHKCMDCRTCVT
jgi:hypothetical protein